MNGAQVYFPPLTKLIKKFMIVDASLFVISSIMKLTSGVGLESYLSLSASKFFSGHFYLLVTHPFIDTDFVSLIFNLLIICFLGPDLEQALGKTKFILLSLFAVLLSSLFYLSSAFFFPERAILGPSGILPVANAMTAAFAYLYPQRQFTFMFLFPMSGKVFCIVLFCIQLYLAFFHLGGLIAWASIGGIAAGFIFMKLGLHKKGFSFSQRTLRKGRAKLHVVKNEDEKPKYWQ